MGTNYARSGSLATERERLVPRVAFNPSENAAAQQLYNWPRSLTLLSGWLRVHTLLGPEFWGQNSFRRVSSVTPFIHSTGSGWGSRSAGRAQSIHSSLSDVLITISWDIFGLRFILFS